MSIMLRACPAGMWSIATPLSIASIFISLFIFYTSPRR
jgi:hypothetical protein